MIERSSSIADTTMKAIEYAMGGLSRRADVRANNIANGETPGFKAKSLSFERQLGHALRNGEIDNVAGFSQGLRDTTPDAFDNTVELEEEVAEMTKDNLMVTAMVNAYNYKVGLLRSAISGGGR